MTPRAMVRAPLEQTMVLLWLIGVGHLYSRFVASEFSFSWVAATVLASVLSVFFVVRYRITPLWPLPVFFGLAALLVLLNLFGVAANGLALASVIFALGLSLGINRRNPRLPAITAGFLGLSWNDENELDAGRIIDVIRQTLFVIALGGGVFQFADSGLLVEEQGHGLVILLTLLAAGLFFWSSGRASRSVRQSYLVLLFSILAVIELVSLSLHHFSVETIFYDRYAGLLFALLGLAMCAVSRWLKPAGAETEEDLDLSLYRKPLMFIAILMAVMSFEIQTLQTLKLDSMAVQPLACLVLVLSAACLFSANYRLKLPLFDLAAMLILIMALMWLEFYFVHPGLSFALWPVGGYQDQWLLLGLFSLAFAFFSYYLECRRTALIDYCPSVTAASAFCYGWTLFHSAVLFVDNPFSENPFLALLCFLLIAAQFPLLRSVSYRESLRAAAVALLLLVALINLLAAGGRVDLLRIGIAVYAYFLLFSAFRVLPLMNARWPQWAVAPDYWPWLGLILIYASLLKGGPGWPGEWPWLLAAASYQLVLRRPYLDLPALLLLVLSALWLQADRLHPGAAFSLWPGRHADPDLWLTLGLAALVYSIVSQWLNKFPLWAIRYSPFLQAGAGACFGWSFLGAAVLFFTSGNGGNPLLPWIFLILLLALFPLSSRSAFAVPIRGAGSALLFALAAVSTLIQIAFIPLQIGIALIGYLLWLIAGYLIPRFNRRLPDWAIAPMCWPWTGLLLVALSGAELHSPITSSLTAYLLMLSGYCLLMLRYSGWAGFSWAAALAFTAAGSAYNGQYLLESLQTQPVSAAFPFTFAVNTLLWANLQLLLVRLINGVNKDRFERFQGRRQDLAAAFEFFASLMLAGWLLAFAFLAGTVFWGGVSLSDMAILQGMLMAGVLLSLSFLHRLSLRFSLLPLHGFIFSLFLIAWTGYFALLPDFVHPPLFLALWCFLPMTAFYLGAQWTGNYQPVIVQALDQWTRFSLIIATAALIGYRPDALLERLLPLAILTGLTAFLGLWTLRPGWFALSCIEFFVFLHVWPFAQISSAMAPALLPWFALQAALLAWLFFAVLRRSEAADKAAGAAANRIAVCRMALAFWPWLIAVSLAELMMHGLLVRHGLVSGQAIGWLFPVWDAAAALGAGSIMLGFGVRHARARPDSSWIYALTLLAGALGYYLRLVALGASPVGLWDTVLLIVFAYGLFFLQRLFPSKPLLNLALLMPLLALLTVPFQLESPEASAALLATGVLYLMVRRHTQKQFPVYLGLLAFNAGLYLWIPGMAQASQLMQVYVIPAALTLLILLQLHRDELKPSVMMATRLAATSTIYACATLDVFLLPDLGVFVLALLLSLSGILLGIALRIRAFLYAGVSFMLLNVLGQLMRFYPEQALGKAVVLMVMGMAIISAMIWFNLKKAVIMQRIGFIRAELQEWE